MSAKKKQENIYSPEFIQEKLRAIPRETTPRRITPPIKRLCKKLASDGMPGFVPVLAASSAKPNAAHENVEDAIRVNGGEHAPWVADLGDAWRASQRRALHLLALTGRRCN